MGFITQQGRTFFVNVQVGERTIRTKTNATCMREAIRLMQIKEASARNREAIAKREQPPEDE
jgi:hypothetical protein